MAQDILYNAICLTNCAFGNVLLPMALLTTFSLYPDLMSARAFTQNLSVGLCSGEIPICEAPGLLSEIESFLGFLAQMLVQKGQLRAAGLSQEQASRSVHQVYFIWG